MTENAEKKTTIDDIKTLDDIHRVFNQTNNEQLEWAKQKLQACGYPQAVQTELAMHRTDLMTFAFNALFKLLHMQELRIAELERLNKGDGK